jgi:hypothetical protein
LIKLKVRCSRAGTRASGKGYIYDTSTHRGNKLLSSHFDGVHRWRTCCGCCYASGEAPLAKESTNGVHPYLPIPHTGAFPEPTPPTSLSPEAPTPHPCLTPARRPHFAQHPFLLLDSNLKASVMEWASLGLDLGGFPCQYTRLLPRLAMRRIPPLL